jgi:serine/threonine protein kinase
MVPILAIVFFALFFIPLYGLDCLALGVKEEELKRIYTFIEKELPVQVKSGRFFFPSTVTGFTCPVEYDPATKHVFIHVGTYLADGYSKKVTKSILYSRERSEVVACCKGPLRDLPELKITQKLQGLPGIVEAKALLKKTGSIELMLKLYNAKSIRALYKQKSLCFSFEQKQKIANDLIIGLSSIHKKGYIHRDLHPGNCLVDIAEDKSVKAAICDFGKTKKREECRAICPQIIRKYRSPEGYEIKKLRPKDYNATDIYSLGCVLYKLYFEKEPPWFSASLSCRPESRQRLEELLQLHAVARLKALERVRRWTREERFEYVILKMLHPNPKLRKLRKV